MNLKSPTINSSSCTSKKCSIYDAHTLRKNHHSVTPFLHDGGGLYITTTLVKSLFTLIIQSNSSNKHILNVFSILEIGNLHKSIKIGNIYIPPRESNELITQFNY